MHTAPPRLLDGLCRISDVCVRARAPKPLLPTIKWLGYLPWGTGTSSVYVFVCVRARIRVALLRPYPSSNASSPP